MAMRFSVITPVHIWNDYRSKSLTRAIESLNNQTFKDFEHIIVNDGSTEEFKVPDYPWIRLFNQAHYERVVAYNVGFSKAEGEIFCLLDSDDEYAPNYLERVDRFFKQWPKYKMFNFGCEYHHESGKVTSRGPFKPKRKRIGHEVFGPGNIVNGTFVFHRDIYDKLGGFPPMYSEIDTSELNYTYTGKMFMGSPWDFSAVAQMEFPEIREYFFIDRDHDPNKAIRELGNPWGNDFYLFYKYTRKYHSKPIEENLYIVHPKVGIA